MAEGTSLKLAKAQRVFVNRSLNMASIKSVGFDMDHTIVTYDRANFEALAFRETLKKFIEAGYPEELSRLTFNPTFVIRGLLVDMDRGNLLKVDGHKYVKIAFHGHERLSKEERHRLYNSESFKAQEFLSIDTFFALSEVQLFTEIVDYMRLNPGKIRKTFKEVYADLRNFIDTSHRDGSIKNEVLANPEHYIAKDKYRVQALVRLIEGGKSLFLLTNSHWDYTHAVMSFLFDGEHADFPKWQDYFSHVFVASGKPGFFTGNQPFYEVMETGLLKQHTGRFQPGRIYHGGNANLFQKLTRQKGDEILYCGDHIYGDIARSKGLFNWRTLLVVEELDHELPRVEELKPELELIKRRLAEREMTDEELQRVRSRVAASHRFLDQAEAQGETKKARYLAKAQEKIEPRIAELEAKLDEQDNEIKRLIREREQKIHPVWGELMRVGLEKSRFAKQVEEYACLYTGRISNLRFYSPYKRFTSPHDIMPHDL